MSRPRRDPIERFDERVVHTCGCWNFLGTPTGRGGYKQFHDGRRLVYAHRFSYERHVGPIPDGLQIDHLCRNTECVNPAHLEPVTARENTRRAAMLRTHCPQGHPYDEANTGRYRGGRYCRTCKRIKALERYYRRKNR